MEAYKKSVRNIVKMLLELIYKFDMGELTENEFYIKWTSCGQSIIETRGDAVARLKED